MKPPPLPPPPRHCRVAHGVTTDGERIFVTGGSAKANANFGPGLQEMEVCQVHRPPLLVYWALSQGQFQLNFNTYSHQPFKLQ